MGIDGTQQLALQNLHKKGSTKFIRTIKDIQAPIRDPHVQRRSYCSASQAKRKYTFQNHFQNLNGFCWRDGNTYEKMFREISTSTNDHTNLFQLAQFKSKITKELFNLIRVTAIFCKSSRSTSDHQQSR